MEHAQRLASGESKLFATGEYAQIPKNKYHDVLGFPMGSFRISFTKSTDTSLITKDFKQLYVGGGISEETMPFRFTATDGKNYCPYETRIKDLQVRSGIELGEGKKGELASQWAHVCFLSKDGSITRSFGKISGFGSDAKGEFLSFAEKIGEKFYRAKIYLKDVTAMVAYGKQEPPLD